MFTINDDLSIYATRGDTVFFTVTAEENGTPYFFEAGDVLRMKIYGKKDAQDVVLEKCFPVTAKTDRFTILLTEEDTKIGEVISKPRDYWYEIELNPFTNPQTIIGYDEDGAKVFKLFPEGKDSEVPEIDPEDIPVVDNELDMTSNRPVENRAIARAIVNIAASCKVTEQEVKENAKNTSEILAQYGGELSAERKRIDNLLSGTTPSDGELADVRVGYDGNIYGTAGSALREQFTALIKRIKEMTFGYSQLQLAGYYEPVLTFEKQYFNSESGKLFDSDIRAISNFIYCPYGSLVDIKCNDGYMVANTGNYDAFGNYLGSGPSFTGMVFRRYVVAKSDNSAITSGEAAENVTVFVRTSRTLTENRASNLLKDYAEVTVGKNLLDRSKSDVGYICDIYGNLTAVDQKTYFTSEFIHIDAGESLTISPRLRKFLVYDENFNPIGDSLVDAETANFTYTATDNCFVRFTYYGADDNVQAEYGTSVTDYVPFEVALNPSVKLNASANTSGSRLNNKVGLSFGDSIMYGSGNSGEGILDILSELYSVSVNDYSVGGASCQYITGRKFIGDQIAEAIEDGVTPDFILLDGLSNDIVHGTIGTMSDSFDYQENGYDTFARGLEYCIGSIKDAFPNVPVLYVIPHSSAGRNYATELEFGNLARDICKKWSVPVADVYSEGNMNARLEKQLQEFTYYPTESSGTHPNRAGYDHSYIPVIVDMLNRIMKY